MSTKYALTYRYAWSEDDVTRTFDSATERALFLICLTPYATIVRSFEVIG